VLYHIECEYAFFLKGEFKRILSEWKALASLIGKEVEVTDFSGNFRGLAEDVDIEGSLIVRLSNGSVKRVSVGNVKARMV
jgi:BirA family biotin operon repressor/biotin-[acetyl-CoA-carboxylase] ligase